MKDLKNHLVEKGWKKKDISKALKIIEHAKKGKHPKIKILDKAVYWFSLLIAIIGNFIISLALMPFLISLKGVQLYIIIITLGLAFGLLFELLVRSIEMQAKHHIFLSIIIPIVAVINFTIVSNNMKAFIGIENHQNSLIVGSVYAVSFMLPYFVYRLFLKNRH